MVYTVQKSQKKLRPEDYFEFTLDGTTTHRLPLLKFLKPGVALRLSAEDPKGMVKLFDEYCPSALDQVEDGDELADLFRAWQEASGVTLGESSASAGS